MSMSGFSNAPLGKDPLRVYEGDPYRARAEAGATSGWTPGERRFQTNCNMAPPQVNCANRNNVEWMGAGQYPHRSATNYHQDCGYQSSGRPTNDPGHHTNHSNNICSPSGHPENSYPSPGHPIKNFMHHNTYALPRHPEMGYPTSEHLPDRHIPSGCPPTGPTGQQNHIPHENGFSDDPSCRHPGPPPVTHPRPQPPRHFWPPVQPHPPTDHTYRSPRPLQDFGEQPQFHPIHPESTHRPQGSKYRTGPDGPNFRREVSRHDPEGYWHHVVPPRDRLSAPMSRTQTSWESSDPRSHAQRRMPPDSNPRINFSVSSDESRRHSYMLVDRNAGAYSPSVSSQSSWSDDTGSPRLRMALPSPSTSEERHPVPPELVAGEPQYSGESQNHKLNSEFQERVRGLSKTPNFSSRPALLKTPDSSSRLLPPGLLRIPDTGREERQATPLGHHERRLPVITSELRDDGVSFVRDPRQASQKLDHLRVHKEHSYSKKYQEGSTNHPLFRQVGCRNNLSPRLLTPLNSTRAKSTTRTPTSSGPPVRGSTSAATTAVSDQREQESNKLSPSATIASRGDDSSTGSECTASSRGHITSGDKSPVRNQIPAKSVDEAIVTAKKMKIDAPAKLRANTVLDDEKNVTSSPLDSKIKDAVTDDPLAKGRDNSIIAVDVKKANSSSTVDGDPLGSLEGFRLDLDLEAATSCSNSNSTCCSESEEVAEERGRDSDGEDGGEGMSVGGTVSSSSSEDEALSLPDDSSTTKSPEKWSVCLPEPGKMRFSRLDNIEDSPDAERLSLKQMTSNRIQLRNGRVLPPSSLAFLAASQKISSPPTPQKESPRTPPYLQTPQKEFSWTPPSSQTPPSSRSPASSQSPGSLMSESPGTSRLRRSKRLAVTGEVGRPAEWRGGVDSTADSDPTADLSFEMQLSPLESSEGSDFEVPLDFPLSPRNKPPCEGRAVRGKRGRGRGRWGRRRGKRGTIRRSARTDEEIHVGSTAHSGVQFYVHEPRTREEDGILQRRKALELEVKRNEKIQSQQNVSSLIDRINTIKDDDRGSVLSGSLPASTSSIDSPPTSSKISSTSTEFSAELIARVKKISTAKSSGDTPLHKCCRTGKFDMVRYLLLVEKSPVNVQDNAGWTPLHEATSNGHTEVAELLLQHGADSNTSAKDGTRPLHDAIEIGCLELVKLLVTHGTDLMVEYGERTAVEFAVDQNQHEIADYIRGVLQVRQEKKATEARLTNSAAHHKATPTRTSRKEKLMKHMEEQLPRIPVNGYGPDCVSFGEELDYPLFYVSPIVELLPKPHLPVYNFQISPPGTSNPRRHNFYLMEDVLKTLNMEEEEFISCCHNVNILELTVAEFLHRMKIPHFNLQVSVPDRIKTMPRKQAIKFVPLCWMLSEMLGIVTENLDN